MGPLTRWETPPYHDARTLLTTVIDLAGFFLVLNLATLFMPQLLA
jgi:hypothetical protein